MLSLSGCRWPPQLFMFSLTLRDLRGADFVTDLCTFQAFHLLQIIGLETCLLEAASLRTGLGFTCPRKIFLVFFLGELDGALCA